MGYYAALCPGALFPAPFLANHDLNPYLWMRDLVLCDPLSISSLYDGRASFILGVDRAYFQEEK